MDAKYQSIEQAWNGLAEAAFGNCSPLQIYEMKKAFYAGYLSSLVTMTQEISQIEEDEGAQAIDDLLEEAAAFFQNIKVQEGQNAHDSSTG